MKNPVLKTLDISAKEWFDEVNGNSYHSVIITVNGEQTLKIPLQYGYGDHYLQAATEALKKEGYPIEGQIVRYCRENGIPCTYDIQTGCLKRDVKRWGE